MNILEEFWYGTFEPSEYDASPSRDYKEMLQLISGNEDNLLARNSQRRVSVNLLLSFG